MVFWKRIARAAGTGCLVAAAGMIICIFDPSVALAQEPNDSADPGQIRRRIEETRPTPVKPQPQPVIVPETPVPEVSAEEEPSFVLTAVVIDGNTVFPAGDLTHLYEDFLVRSITLTEVQEIARRITQKYRDAGYILSQALVPPQEVVGGLLLVRIVEGYIARVTFEGAPGQEQLLAPYADNITALRPISLSALERHLLLINDLAGITVADTALRRIDDRGAYEMTVSVSYDSLDGVAYMDNRGTPSVGRLQGWLSGGANSLLGWGERVQLGFFTVPNQPRELLYAELKYLQPIGAEGTTLTATASGSRIDAGDNLAAVDSDGESARYALRLDHPLLLSRSSSLSLYGSFDYLDVGEDRLGVTNFQDHLRVVRVGLDYTREDSWKGATSLAVEISQGLDIFGASNSGDTELSRTDGDGAFTKATAQLTRVQGIGEDFAVWTAIKGQVSADPLLSAEEFDVGGSEFGRAYDFSELTGEDGLAASVELRYGQTLNAELLTAFQLYGFYDFGAVWNDDAPGNGRATLASVGGGVRLTLPRSIFANVEIAKPLTRAVSTTGDQEVRVFFSLSATF